MPHKLIWLTAIALLAASNLAEDAVEGHTAAPAEDRSARQSSGQIDFTASAKLTVALSDEQGQPVIGAEVMPYAMRMQERRGHGYWDKKVYGPPRAVLSDENGKAVIQYPAHVRRGPDIMTTRLVSFSVIHVDFVKETVHFGLGPDEAEVTLTAGCEVKLSAVDADRHPIRDFGVLMAGPSNSDLWVSDEDGSRRCRAIREGTWQSMLVKLQDDGPTLFSGVLPLRVRKGQLLRFLSITLLPGAIARGELSDNVPRPVIGYVMATAVSEPAGNSWDKENPSLLWHDWTEILPNGTFEFASLPRRGKLQLIAVCDGWLSTTISDEPVAKSQIMGQVFQIDDEELSFVLDMEPTGTLHATFVTEDGRPFTEGKAHTSPNQRYLKGGTTLLGRRTRSDSMIRNQFLPANEREPFYDKHAKNPYVRNVGPDGTVTLTDLPIGRPQIFGLAAR